jgi:hypothetical protein
MPKFRSVIVLPSVQFVLAIVLLQWGFWAGKHPPGKFDTVYVATPGLLCLGLNAPAVVLRMLAGMFLESLWPGDHLWGIAGFGGEDLSFLAGVAVLWYLVGRSLDRRVLSTGSRTELGSTRYKLWQVMQMFWGGMVLWILVRQFNDPLSSGLLYRIRAGLGNYNNALGCILLDLGLLVWSLVLLIGPAIRLAKHSGGAVKPTARQE